MKNKILLILITLIFILITFSGCNDNQDKSSQKSMVKIVEKSKNINVIDDEEKDNTIALNRGNILRVATINLKGNFNPIIANDRFDTLIVDAVFDGLITINETGEVTNNGLAKGWTISKDKKTYTFSLRDNVKFHDGEKFSAEDVEFTFYTIADSNYKGPRKSIINDIVGIDEYRSGVEDKIKGIRIIDENKIAFDIKEPNVKKIRDFKYGIMPKHYYSYEDYKEFMSLLSYPIGTGIMEFSDYKDGESCELKTNENYFANKAKIDGVEIQVLPDEIQAISLASGEIDLANPIANINNYEIINKSGIASVQEFLTNSYRYIGFNTRLEKFSNKKVRQALSYGIKMNDYIEAQWDGFAQPCYSPISPISWAAPDQDKLNKYEYNLEKAQNLLKEAGWYKNRNGKLMKNGKPFIIKWTSYKEEDWPLNLISVAKNNWGELGIEVQYDIMEFNKAKDKIFNQQDFEVYNMSWNLDADPDPYEIFHSDNDIIGGFNSVGFSNQLSDKLIELAKNQYDRDKRRLIYQQWSELINREAPYIFVSIGTNIWGVNERVKNIELGPYSNWVNNLDKIELDFN